LALLQLGEALRRMAIQARYGRVLPADPDSIYSAADDVLNEAHSLFLPPDSDSPDYALRISLNEPLRLVEAKIELGCLFRDRIRAPGSEDLSPHWMPRYREAMKHLQTAADMAHDLGLKRHEIDARVNLAWTHFYAGDIDEAAKALDAAEGVLQEKNAEYFIRPKSPAEPGGFAPESQHLDEFFIFSQLSKAYNLRGLMILRQFKKRIGEIDLEFPGDERRESRQEHVHDDPVAQQCLERIAECYTLGTAYAQLYSPRSSALSMLYDRLYDFLKKLNGRELDDFHHYVIRQRNRYPSEQIKRSIEDLGNIDQFMHEVFGLSQDVKSSGGVDGN
jgi:tetratricopeptide (TPR) repeat protein